MTESIHTNNATTVKPQTTAMLIANPTAGSYLLHVAQLTRTLKFLRQHGWQAELRLTHAAGDAGKLAREAVEHGTDVVVAAGGDGTIHEIIQQLAGSTTALGVIPSGTVNVWAREVGIPLDEVGARDVLVHGQTRSIDLGKINERYFLLMVGIGIDGAVTHAVEKQPVKHLGVLAYLLIGAWLGIGYRDFRVMLELNGRVIRLRALQVVVGNTQLYAGALKYTWQAKCDDGLLDICVVRKQGLLGRVAMLLDFLLRRQQRRQWVRYETASVAKIYTRQPVPIQVDGEPNGYTSKDPTVFTLAPAALKVIVPQNVPEELFSQ